MTTDQLPIAIIGAGPVGLAAAAHLNKYKLPFILFEAGSAAGSNILNWMHVKVFSPWRYNIDKAAEALLSETNWQSPDKEELHTGWEFYEQYLEPLAKHPSIQPFIHLNSKVIAISRKNMDKMKTKDREKQPFVLEVAYGNRTRFYEARAVIDASGTWQNANPIGAGGLYAKGEKQNADRIFYGIPDVTGSLKDRYKNKNVLVIGSGHSAINTILELDQLKTAFPLTEIHWIFRKEKISEVYGGKEDDALPARGSLGIRIEKLINEDRVSVYTPFYIQEIEKESGTLNIRGIQYGVMKQLSGIDEIIANTGARPDYSMLREVRVEFDATVESVPAIADLIDPNIHSCGTVRAHGEMELRQKEKDFYIVGMKSYGRAPTFLMATGYEQVRSIAAALAGDWESARRVELDLPETGVCKSDGGDACCGAPEKELELEQSCCG
ncbi:MAG TPA: NAD(P)-binding domain-containing protein [Chitinophagaceae bacterium]